MLGKGAVNHEAGTPVAEIVTNTDVDVRFITASFNRVA
jgi:hypothetical protein